MWITITTTLCATFVSALTIILGYFLMSAGIAGGETTMSGLVIKASGGFEVNLWSFGPGILLAGFGCGVMALTVHRTIKKG
nr:hypothetical protein 20 [bacterium]BDD47933.1 hypothetical protein 7 [bacterium]